MGPSQTCWPAFRLEVITMALSPRVTAKAAARLHPSGVMKGSTISTASRGKPSGRQHLCVRGHRSGAGVLLQWWTAQHTDPRLHARALPPRDTPHPSLHRGLSTRTHTPALLAAISEHFMQRTRCLGAIATAPHPPDLAFTMCRLCY